MKSILPDKRELGDRVNTWLKIRIIFYLVLSISITGISIYHTINEDTNVFYPLVGFFSGMLIGILASRILTITWDQGARKVISRMDTVGIIILIVYTMFEYYRSNVVSYFVEDRAVISVSFALLAGIMYGRLLGIRGKITELFQKHNIKE